MAPDNYTEVTNKGCGSNVLGSCVGTIIGLILFVAAFPLLWWNEQRSLERANALHEGARIVVKAMPEKVDPGNEGKLVYLTGKALTPEMLQDRTFGISVRMLRLKRTAEMYQWQEEKDERTEKQIGGGSHTVTTYSYQKAWSDQLRDSQQFRHPEGHQNPAQMPYESHTFQVSENKLGAFHLSEALLAKLQNFKPYPITPEMASKLPAAERQVLKFSDGKYYRGANPATPQIGDARISFAVVPQQDVSLVARQVQDTFEPYQIKKQQIELIEPGTLSTQTLFQHELQRNNILTWILRVVGTLLMIIGIALVFGPLQAIGNVIPFVGDLVGAGTGCVAAGIGAALSAGTIALAWVVIRPLIGVPLFIAMLGILVLLLAHGRRRRAS